MGAATKEPAGQSRDESRLAELGYKQELSRSWSGFQNFAISFTIISVLAGCFTTYYQAWNNGGPIAISWGWPIISAFILIIAFCMAELVSAFPTAGGIYWWSSRLGNPMWGWFTGWFNLLGLIAILASVDYFCAQFLGIVLGLYNVDFLGLNFGDAVHGLRETFILFALILGAARLHQHPRQPPRRRVQRHLRVVAPRRRRGDHRDPHLRPRQPRELQRRSSPTASTTRASARTCSGGTCCRSASC